MLDGAAKQRTKRVLIADPQPIFRLGLVALLDSAYPGWDVAESGSLLEYRSQLRDAAIDLLIIDSHLFGLEVAQRALDGGCIHADVDIIAITEPDDAIGAYGCLGAGANATISRADPTGRTLATIAGMTASHHRAATRPGLAEPPQQVPKAGEILKLTARQFDVLRSLAKGQSNKVIARDLGLSVSTVKVHLNTVFRALGARNRVEAVVRARPFQDSLLAQQQ
jgi:two-component system nitrate/nitrite response regulator NarL